MPPKKSTTTAATANTRSTRAAASKTAAAAPATTSKANGKKRAAADHVDSTPAKKTTTPRAKKTANKATANDDNDDEEDAGDVNEREIIASFSDVSADSSSDDDDGDIEEEEQVNSSDEDDEDDRFATEQPRSSLASVKLPNSKDDAVVRARLDKLRKSKSKSKSSSSTTTPGVLYIGRLPKGFFEKQLKSYFSQFGDVTRLRVSRNKKTGAFKHYAFIEFADQDVAKIVQETMHNYLIDGRLLQVKQVEREKVHPELWVGANRKFQKVPGDRLERVVRSRAKTEEEEKNTVERKLRRQHERRERLKKLGIEYEFEGYTKEGAEENKGVASKAKSTPVKGGAKAKTAKA